MRMILLAFCLATPATAWEFTPGRVCFLAQNKDGLDVVLSHDPAQPLFTISLTRETAWPEGDVFAIRFSGASPFTITTNRHTLSNGGRTLTVADTGFTNVLAGMRFNDIAYAVIGDEQVPFSLSGAGAGVPPFADCTPLPAV